MMHLWVIFALINFCYAHNEELTDAEKFFRELENCKPGFVNYEARFPGFSKPVEIKKVVDRFNAGKEIYKVFPLVGASIRIELVSTKRQGYGPNRNDIVLYQVC